MTQENNKVAIIGSKVGSVPTSRILAALAILASEVEEEEEACEIPLKIKDPDPLFIDSWEKVSTKGEEPWRRKNKRKGISQSKQRRLNRRK